ncbi:CcdB family protein [Magnetospirillum sp. SS-4]|uniref:CcdB family protein n=1 Tax=Magnetospirillum sp. SS-4 TaxID=2681465 RepID=UPI001574AB3E|nr:CcdB family protein [Magnetospirillum sp. SS-4]
MAQFDLYPSDGGLLLDVQSDILDGLETRMIVPLLPLAELARPAQRLNPVFMIGDSRYVMAPQFMASAPLSELTTKVGSLSHEHFVIKAAINMVFDGV